MRCLTSVAVESPVPEYVLAKQTRIELSLTRKEKTDDDAEYALANVEDVDKQHGELAMQEAREFLSVVLIASPLFSLSAFRAPHPDIHPYTH